MVLAVGWRLASLARSRANEASLRRAGAVEVGARNSLALTVAHVAIYLGAIGEGAVRGFRLDGFAAAGLVLYGFGAVMLALVIRDLGRVWTVKVFIAPDHVLVRTWLFRTFRHPNYMLAIGPELVGLCLALHAVVTLAWAVPVYGALLWVRIRLEEAAMRERFTAY
ncbi:isoprenylcysteine carboxylmethyltransferase family protein [Caulobacter endophyticus]|uniref:isoprenylcysteine carboxylmethyltransferase family protein n=1 Tax=Caulobacter endophyticus TaxID=2172652 RepID=UPI00240F048F|nr:isoprenylcysteine carboxylmethyltransferase family protein [Caulobacter endophyticus]MDG2531561.1 isoprenylcysteine carboxylmethyltransferase family protein [Caulobacter endophyticus]